MKLVRFHHRGDVRIGKVVDGGVIDLSNALAELGGSMRRLITDLAALRPVIEAATGPIIPLAQVRLVAPVGDPQKFLAIGMNYKEHAAEAVAAGLPPVTRQAWFSKAPSCLNGPYDPIDMPRVSDQLDYEGELVYVIGKRCRDVKAVDAMDVVAGYMVGNDVSVRDWQRASPTVMLGKSFDTHGPMGPWLTLVDEVDDPYALELRTFVNGEERQRSLIADLIYDIGDQIEHISTVMTLEPGDIISTGTPAGTGLGLGKILKTGDVVRVEIDRLGYIENRVEAQPPSV